MLFRRIVLHRNSVFERHAVQQCFNLVGAADLAPAFLRFLDQLEVQSQEGRTRHAVARTRGPVSHGGEGRLDRIGLVQMLPVLGREVVKRQQAVTVLDQFFHRLRVLGLVRLHKLSEGYVSVGSRGRHTDRLQARLGFGLLRSRQRISSHYPSCGTSKRCATVAGNTSSRAAQKPIAPSPAASRGPACKPRAFRSSNSSHHDSFDFL